MLGGEVQRYRQDGVRFDHLTNKLTNGMPGRSQLDASMGTDNKDTTHITQHSAPLSNGHLDEELENSWKASKKAAASKGTNLTRSGSVKNLIYKFSASDGDAAPAPLEAKTEAKKGATALRGKDAEKDSENETLLPALTVTPAAGESKCPANPSVPPPKATDFLLGQEKPLGSPPSEEEPLTPKPTTTTAPSTKYQLFTDREPLGNGTSGPGGPVGAVPKSALTRRSMESLVPRDWDSAPDKVVNVESPPRVFNSPYSTLSGEYNPANRISEYKVSSERLSPATSELNLFGLNRSSNSPLSSPTVLSPRSRFSAYDTLTRRREQQQQQQQAPPGTQLLMRNNLPNKRDFIEELTKQLDTCQRRNQFLEAESIELEKERTQIRFEMRNLLVNNEDLLRMNTQLQGELKRLRERSVEIESDRNVMSERLRKMELEIKEAREVMVEANTQEYAFNFLQQSLKNKIQDAEEALEKQTQHAQSLSEKLWLAERNLEELQLEKETKGKKTVELNTTVQRLETELAETLQQATQTSAELNLQQKLRVDAQHRVEELEESLLEKDQEVLRLQQIISRLQGEVSDKLLDKECSLEEEIQLRERIQLQCKQAERTVEDLHMEIQTLTQAREDLNKQLKQAQEKMIDLETDLEEMQENEQRWSSKYKRALDQSEQLQLKLIQEKDLNDQLECEKVILERQVRDLRSENEELQNNRVEEHLVNKAESRAKELENTLRAEERSKVTLNNTISKLERKVNELTDQLEEDSKTFNEQKDLMTQRMRSLKRQLNEAEEETSRRESQYRHTQRELTEEREANGRLNKQLMELQLHLKRKESVMTRQILRLDVSEDEEELVDDKNNPAD